MKNTMKNINLPIEGLIQVLNKNSYMIADHLYQLKYFLQHNITHYLQYVHFKDSTYCKNLVYKNHLFEVLIICWKPGQASGIHKHPKNGCIMKILEGTLVEERHSPVNITTRTYKKNDILFIKDKSEHVIKNISHTRNLITLHIYSPSNFYKSKI